MSLQLLPDVPLNDGCSLGAWFRESGFRDYRSAARYVRDLPYGRNTDRADYRRVLREARGTCSTKHALLAALAREHEVPVELRLGIYEMDAYNTPGIGEVLRRYGFDAVPEAHCYLACGGSRVDLTDASSKVPERFLYEETIEPGQIGAYKVAFHRDFLREWAAGRNLDAERLWRAREECIGALSRPGDA